jgi:hypothetical protein
MLKQKSMNSAINYAIRKAARKRQKVDKNQRLLDLDFMQDKPLGDLSEDEIFQKAYIEFMKELDIIFKRIFKEAAKLCHPDINKNLPNAENIFKELSNARDKRNYWQMEAICWDLFKNDPRTNLETYEDIYWNEYKKLKS